MTETSGRILIIRTDARYSAMLSVRYWLHSAHMPVHLSASIMQPPSDFAIHDFVQSVCDP